ncbi:MAG: hypothetical protein U0905_07065 [Pirellulales bacterium]
MQKIAELKTKTGLSSNSAAEGVDVGTVPDDVRTEMGTDVGTVPDDVRTETGTVPEGARDGGLSPLLTE